MSTLRKIYGMKLHTKSVYKDFAITIKSFSHALSGRLSAWGDQDSTMADTIREMAFDDKEVFENGIVFYPFTVHKIGKNDNPAIIAQNILKEIQQAEAHVAAALKTTEMSGFYDISVFRIGEINRIQSYIANGSLFSSRADRPWTCAKCGLPYQGPTPPDGCPACGAAAGCWVRSYEIGEE